MYCSDAGNGYGNNRPPFSRYTYTEHIAINFKPNRFLTSFSNDGIMNLYFAREIHRISQHVDAMTLAILTNRPSEISIARQRAIITRTKSFIFAQHCLKLEIVKLCCHKVCSLCNINNGMLCREYHRAVVGVFAVSSIDGLICGILKRR